MNSYGRIAWKKNILETIETINIIETSLFHLKNVGFFNSKLGTLILNSYLQDIYVTLDKDVRRCYDKNHDVEITWCWNQNTLFDLLFAVVVRK